MRIKCKVSEDDVKDKAKWGRKVNRLDSNVMCIRERKSDQVFIFIVSIIFTIYVHPPVSVIKNGDDDNKEKQSMC